MTTFRRTHTIYVPAEEVTPLLKKRIVFEVEDTNFRAWGTVSPNSPVIREMVEAVGRYVDRVVEIHFLEEKE